MKILMTTMSLDIGGAETHIVELSKRLRECGEDVTVASFGGVYVTELERCGIRHVTLPLHNKHPRSLLSSYRGLYRLIKEERFDIVHAHARIPAFICGLLQKRLHFRFVTTTHGTFAVNTLLKRLSNWGDRSLAVSYDIKRYLIENYGMPSDSITCTVNGIDTRRFCEKDGDAAMREFGLSPDSLKIVHVSRIDREVSSVAHMLVRATEDLIENGVDAQLLIVGGGDDLPALRDEAEELCERLGRDAVVLAGPRTDVDRLLAAADIFVGVSRSALEALSEGKLCVLAGAQGYGGIFRPELLDLSLDTNFCFRDEPLPTAGQIASDIRSLCGMSDEEKAFLRSFGRETVEKYYSINRMYGDALSVYEKLLRYEDYKYGDIILSGYYGFGNLGDDSLLDMIIENLRAIRPDVKITVLSRRPRETAKRYCVKSIQRFWLPAVSRQMKHAKLLVNGGGSLLQNSTSTRSLFYYLHIMQMAKRRGLKLMLYASGIGPLFGEKNKERCRRILDETDVADLREEESYKEVVALGAKPKRMEVTVDPAFLTVPAGENWVRYLCRKAGVELSGNNFAVSLRSWDKTDPECERKLLAVFGALHEKYGLTPVFISMQKEKDLALCERLSASYGGRVLDGLSASELRTVMSGMKFVLAMRLHALIYAVSAGTPVIGLSYDPKIDALLSSFDCPYAFDVRSFDEHALFDAADEAYRLGDEIRDRLSEKLKEKLPLAVRDAENVFMLLDEK